MIERLGVLPVALVNVSTVEDDPSRQLFRRLLAEGNRVVPVRPGVKELDGRPAYPRLQDVPLQLGGAILLVSPRFLDRFLEECRTARVTKIWLDESQYTRLTDTAMHARMYGIGEVSTLKLPTVSLSRKKARTTLRWIGDVIGARREPK